MALRKTNGEKIFNNITTGKEYETNYKIDSKIVYFKRISLGQLPNKSSKAVSTGLNLKSITIIGTLGYAYNQEYNYGQSIPNGNSENQIHIEFDANNIIVATTTDRTKYNGYLLLIYIKN